MSAPSPFRPDLLAGRVAFVAGGTSGINLAIAQGLAAHGAAIAVMSRTPDWVAQAVMSRTPDRVAQAVATLQAGGATAVGTVGDVRQYAQVEAAMAQARESLGAFDIVVSGAAGNFLCPADRLSPNGFRAVVEIDLIGTFHVYRAAVAHTRTPGASFITISAPQSTEVYWGQSHVSAAKAGVDMLTRSLAVEWGERGIRVNGIVPGPIAGTEGIERLAPTGAIRDSWTQANPLRRFGTGAEIAHAAIFLASDAAAYVNGAMLYVDGGQVHSAGRDYRASWQALQDAGEGR